MNNGDMPAYPVTNQNGEPVDLGNGVTLIYSTGMTKRETFAMNAPPEEVKLFLPLPRKRSEHGIAPLQHEPSDYMKARLAWADALIKALEEKK